MIRVKQAFFPLAAALASFASMPSQAQTVPSMSAPAPGVTQDQTQNTSEIATWNNYIETHPQSFSWEAHNELRHLYGFSDAAKSMQQVDIILAHSLMDGYMMGILSDWQLNEDQDAAVDALQNKADRYASLPFLRTACLLQMADIRRSQERFDEARTLNQNAEKLARQSRRDLSKVDRVRLKNYQKLARLQLDQVRLFQQ